LKGNENQTLKIPIMGSDILLVSEIISHFRYWQAIVRRETGKFEENLEHIMV